MKKKSFPDIQQKAMSIRRHVVAMAVRGKTSHVGSALSCTDILAALYFKIMNIDPQDWDNPKADRFILSKGHGVMAWFAVLAERGFFNTKVLEEYAMDGSRLAEHPGHGLLPGIKVTTGSLGHGLPIGVGMAMAKKMDRLPSRIFVVLSDGECNEGSVWEAAMYGAHQKLDNLVAIVDFNNMQAMGRSTEVNSLEPLAKKWEAFGWEVKEIDGHDTKQIIETLQGVPFKKGRPNAVIAKTVLGKGVSFMEDHLLWHYQIPSDEQLKQALEELKLS